MAGYKTVNLEQGMPTADRAIRRLTYELAAARQMRYAAVKLIHGYGSSGTGGRRNRTRSGAPETAPFSTTENSENASSMPTPRYFT